MTLANRKKDIDANKQTRDRSEENPSRHTGMQCGNPYCEGNEQRHLCGVILRDDVINKPSKNRHDGKASNFPK